MASEKVLQLGSVLKLGEGSQDYLVGFSKGYVTLGHIGQAVVYEDERGIMNAMRRKEFSNDKRFSKSTFIIERVIRRLDMPNG